VLDLHVAAAPKATLNFLKLCKAKYFNDCCFFNLQRGFTISCGDPSVPAAGALTAGGDDASRIKPSKGGDSIYGLMYGGQARFFPNEITATLGHAKKGTVSLLPVGGKDHANASAFFITLGDDLTYLDGKHTVFATVAEGLEEFQAKLTGVITDENQKPRQNIKIRHTIILEGQLLNRSDEAECAMVRTRA
jgi:peptidyl-prolyl cis-trans isomerase-like 4